jgi:hypothetical protein
VALEQNTCISICGKKCSAFYIKHEIIKNVRNRPPGIFACDSNQLHPFIDLAFFMPKGGSLPLESVMFHDTEWLQTYLYANVWLVNELLGKVLVGQ